MGVTAGGLHYPDATDPVTGPTVSGATQIQTLAEDVDAALSGKESTAHAALATGVHGVGTGDVVGTDATQTLANKSLDQPNINDAHSWSGLFEYPTLSAPGEVVAISGTGATGTINLDALDKTVLLITANAAANWTINLRGNSDSSLDSVMDAGMSVTFVVLAQQGATAYYPNTIKVDGTTVTVKWAGGVAPTFGNANSIDAYTLTAIKTAAATFTVLGGQARFA